MKKHGILNSEIASVLANLGHTDYICIADCGLPIPPGVKKIDISLRFGCPSATEVTRAIVDDMIIEEVIMAQEIKEANPKVHSEFMTLKKDVHKRYVKHEQFKQLTGKCKAIIRTGENTPYANIILVSGVNFGKEGQNENCNERNS